MVYIWRSNCSPQEEIWQDESFVQNIESRNLHLLSEGVQLSVLPRVVIGLIFESSFETQIVPFFFSTYQFRFAKWYFLQLFLRIYFSIHNYLLDTIEPGIEFVFSAEDYLELSTDHVIGAALVFSEIPGSIHFLRSKENGKSLVYEH